LHRVVNFALGALEKMDYEVAAFLDIQHKRSNIELVLLVISVLHSIFFVIASFIVLTSRTNGRFFFLCSEFLFDFVFAKTVFIKTFNIRALN